MATNNAINLKAQGLAYYDGAGLFSAPTITQYYVVIGSTGNNVTAVAPSATSGVALISQGSSSNPAFGTVVVAGGGTGLTSLTAYALMAGGTTSTGNMQQVSGLGSAGQVLTSAGAGALPTWSAVPTNPFPWTVITAATLAMANNNGYISNAASGGVTYTLPSTAAVGTELRVTGLAGGSGWFIDQNALQSIQIGSSASTVGTGGSLASTANNDTVELICAVANTTWVVTSSMGNITVV